MSIKNKTIHNEEKAPLKSTKESSYEGLSNAEKVRKIKSDLKCGSYIVKSKEIADKMVQKIKEKVIFNI